MSTIILFLLLCSLPFLPARSSTSSGADEVSSYVSEIISTIKDPLRQLQTSGLVSSSSERAISTAIRTIEQSKPNLIKILEVVITLAEQLKRDSSISDRLRQTIVGVKNTFITSNFDVLRLVSGVSPKTKDAIETAEQQLTRNDVNDSPQVLRNLAQIIQQDPAFPEEWKIILGPPMTTLPKTDKVSSYVSEFISLIKEPLRQLQTSGLVSSSSNTAISTAIRTIEQSKPNLIKIFEVVITLAEQLKRDSLIPDNIRQAIEGLKNTFITSSFDALRSVRGLSPRTKDAIDTAEQHLMRNDVNDSPQVLRNLAQIIQLDPAFPEELKVILELPNHANPTKMCGTITLLLSFVSMIVVYVA